MCDIYLGSFGSGPRGEKFGRGPEYRIPPGGEKRRKKRIGVEKKAIEPVYGRYYLRNKSWPERGRRGRKAPPFTVYLLLCESKVDFGKAKVIETELLLLFFLQARSHMRMIGWLVGGIDFFCVRFVFPPARVLQFFFFIFWEMVARAIFNVVQDKRTDFPERRKNQRPSFLLYPSRHIN